MMDGIAGWETIAGREWSQTLACKFSASLRVPPRAHGHYTGRREGFQPFAPYKFGMMPEALRRLPKSAPVKMLMARLL
jgi:hypothetical protein